VPPSPPPSPPRARAPGTDSFCGFLVIRGQNAELLVIRSKDNYRVRFPDGNERQTTEDKLQIQAQQPMASPERGYDQQEEDPYYQQQQQQQQQQQNYQVCTCRAP